MTANELRHYFDDTYGFQHFPVIYEADHETFANVCSFVFKSHIELPQRVGVSLGMHGGIYFKGVEIVLKDKT